MVFSFFKKQSNKMPERPAARPRPATPPPEAKPAEPEAAPAQADSPPLREPLPDLEFTTSNVSGVSAAPAKPADSPAVLQAPRVDAADFSFDDFEHDFTESSVMGIDVDQDVDPLQACVEQVVVLYANGQDAAARNLLETFVRAYSGNEGKRFWLLLLDLLQVTGDRAAFDKQCVEFAEACETSPPTWRNCSAGKQPAAAGVGPRKVFLQGVLTSESDLPIKELTKFIAQKDDVVIECSKLVGCDDEVAGRLATLLTRARKAKQTVTLVGIDAFLGRLDARLAAGEATHEDAWVLLLELLQRHGTQEHFEERAVDYAVSFERSPPSWEVPPGGRKPVVTGAGPADDAHYLTGDLKGCRFEDLIPVIEYRDQPILDFSGVTRLDFVSAGQLVNRLSPYKAAGREIIIRSPNHLVAELMAVVGLNKMARIIVPKS